MWGVVDCEGVPHRQDQVLMGDLVQGEEAAGHVIGHVIGDQI